MARLRFTKMHGIGNDYVYIDCFSQSVSDPPALAQRVSPRHTGIGSDGLILIRPSDEADCRMEMYNADGSRGRMCGNGIRCVAKYVYDHGIARRETLRIDTDAGACGQLSYAKLPRTHTHFYITHIDFYSVFVPGEVYLCSRFLISSNASATLARLRSFNSG